MRPRSSIHGSHRPIVAAIGFAVALTLVVLGPTPAATAAGGHKLWVARYDRAIDGATALVASPDGERVFVAGHIWRRSGSQDFATVAYKARTGAKVWVSVYGGPEKEVVEPVAIALSPDGTRVYETGDSWEGGSHGYATVAYDASTGTQVWENRYDAYGGVTALAVSPDGTRVYVTGSGGLSGIRYTTVALDAATGAVIWASRQDRSTYGSDHAAAIGVSPDGARVYVTGSVYHGVRSYDDFGTVAYDALTGARIWLRRYNGSANSIDDATALGLSPDGTRVYVTGRSYDERTLDDYATVAYDADTGAKVWHRRYHSAGPSIDDATALAVSPDGTKVYVTGSSFGWMSETNYDFATVAYDAVTGADLWLRRYTSPGYGVDRPRSLAVSPDGARVYVVGAGQSDYATVAYDSTTGVKVWVRRYDGTGSWDDEAHAVEVSPDSTRVYVTGTSYGPVDEDYVTIAYSAN